MDSPIKMVQNPTLTFGSYSLLDITVLGAPTLTAPSLVNVSTENNLTRFALVDGATPFVLNHIYAFVFSTTMEADARF
jgi:hypothetical protein